MSIAALKRMLLKIETFIKGFLVVLVSRKCCHTTKMATRTIDIPRSTPIHGVLQPTTFPSVRAKSSMTKAMVMVAPPIQSTVGLTQPSGFGGGGGISRNPATLTMPAKIAMIQNTHFQPAYSPMTPAKMFPNTLPKGALWWNILAYKAENPQTTLLTQHHKQRKHSS